MHAAVDVTRICPRAARASRAVGHMPPSRKPTKKDDSLKRGTRYSGGSSYRKDSYGHKEPQWTTQIHQKLPKKLPDDVLAAAKKMFFELDRDNSGSIDADELGVMLRSLGQNPTDEELRALIASVDGADGGESDGQIQLREFLRLYSDAVDNDGKKVNKVDRSDVYNVFQTFGGQIAVRVYGSPAIPHGVLRRAPHPVLRPRIDPAPVPRRIRSRRWRAAQWRIS